MNRLRKPARMHALLGMAAAWSLSFGAAPPANAVWSEYAMVSATMGVSDGRLCLGETSRGDIGCPAYAPFVNATTGYVGIGTSSPSATLHVKTSTATSQIWERQGYASAMLTMGGSGAMYMGWMNPSGGFGNGISLASNTNYVGIGLSSKIASTSLHIAGTLRLADGAESCDTDRLGALKYTSNQFYICQNTATGWESLATTSSNTTVAINTGLSGSIVFRDEYGVLKARDSFSISSTTGSVGIGAGAPSSIGNNGLYASGNIRSAGTVLASWFYPTDSSGLHWGNGGVYDRVTGDASTGNHYLAFTTSSTEAMRIVSTGYVGIGTTNPAEGNLVVRGTNSPTIAVISTGHGQLAMRRTTHISRLGSFSTGVGSRNFEFLSASDWNDTERSLLYMNGSSGNIGFGTTSPSTALHVSGTLKIADGGESCDSYRLGAIKYTSNQFYICQNTATGWESLATTGEGSAIDRIASSSMAGVTANSTGYISLSTGGVNGTGYFTPASVLVNAGISTTGGISGSTGYFSGKVGIGTTASTFSFEISASRLANDYAQIVVGGIGPSHAGQIMFRRGGDGNALGNIGYATSTTTGDFKIRSAGGSGNIEMNATNDIYFTTAGGEIMRIIPTGNVGIGTNSPAAKLDVSGTISATLVKLANDPQDACTNANIGAIKSINGRLYTCRQ